MKKLCLLIVALVTTLMSFGQVPARYGVGAVPVVNNRVTFETTIEATEGMSEQAIYDKAVRWMEKRFAVPAVKDKKQQVISAKTIENDAVNHHIVVNAEEWMVFTDRFFNLDRTRINYWLEVAPADGKCTLRMTRIKYWYEEERDGGQRFSAEEWITDEQCINAKGKLLKVSGKFRRNTIDLFYALADDLRDIL